MVLLLAVITWLLIFTWRTARYRAYTRRIRKERAARAVAAAEALRAAELQQQQKPDAHLQGGVPPSSEAARDQWIKDGAAPPPNRPQSLPQVRGAGVWGGGDARVRRGGGGVGGRRVAFAVCIGASAPPTEQQLVAATCVRGGGASWCQWPSSAIGH